MWEGVLRYDLDDGSNLRQLVQMLFQRVGCGNPMAYASILEMDWMLECGRALVMVPPMLGWIRSYL